MQMQKFGQDLQQLAISRFSRFCQLGLKNKHKSQAVFSGQASLRSRVETRRNTAQLLLCLKGCPGEGAPGFPIRPIEDCQGY